MLHRTTAALSFVTILLSLSAFAGLGPFRPFQLYGTGGAAAGPVAVADVNGDGKPDLLVGNIGTATSPGSLGVLLGNGDGTFQAVKTYSVGGYNVRSLVVFDINKDGRPDVLIAEQAGVSILLGNGNGTFQAPTILPMSNLSALTVADVNNDGNADLLLALYCGGGLDCGAGVLLGHGDGTFGTLQVFGSYLGLGYILAADVNHDGKIDILVYGQMPPLGFQRSSGVGVFLGDGHGGFTWNGAQEAGGWGETAQLPMAIADINQDGNPDVITANDCVNIDCVQGSMGVLLGQGDGNLAFLKRTANTGGWRGGAVAIADINRDGVPDVLVSNMCNNFSECDYPTVGLLLGKGDGTFLPATAYDTGAVAFSYGEIAAADVNGDGTPDVFATSGSGVSSGGGMVSVLLSLFDTTTSLATSSNHSTYGQPVTLTATVGTNGPIPPTGSVSFLGGKVQVGAAALAGNTATFQAKALPAGTYPITATYRGDTLTARSTSTALSETVDKAATTTGLQSSLNPSTHSQTVKFTATVTSPTTKPTGTVTFMAGTTTLGTVTLAGGKASLSTTTLAVGSTKITANYNGTTNIIGSSVSLTQVVH